MQYHTSGRKILPGPYAPLLIIITLLLTSCGLLKPCKTVEIDAPPLAILAEGVGRKLKGDHLKQGKSIPPIIPGPLALSIVKDYYPDPGRLEPLKEIHLTFFSPDGREVVVLGCDLKTGLKLFEDSTSTTKIDVRSWETGYTECTPSLTE